MSENQFNPQQGGVPQQGQPAQPYQGDTFNAVPAEQYTGAMPVQGYDANGQPFAEGMPAQFGQQPYDAQQYTGAMPVQGYDPNAQQYTGAMPVQGYDPNAQQYTGAMPVQGQHFTGAMPNPTAPPAPPSEVALSASALGKSVTALAKGNTDGAIDAIVGRKHVWWIALGAGSLVASLYSVMALARTHSSFWEMLVQYVPDSAAINMGRSFRDDDYGLFGFGMGVGIVAIGIVLWALYFAIRAAGVYGVMKVGGARLPWIAAASVAGVGQLPLVAATALSFVLTVIPGGGFVEAMQWVIIPLILFGWLASELLTYAGINRVAQYSKPVLLPYAVVSTLSQYVGLFLTFLLLLKIGGEIIGS
ncbi:hypothetical protein JT358_15665 [Micrococcales bacterium 31B]|nr:hypothetical protein [Micrococcales bacterium 31B]